MNSETPFTAIGDEPVEARIVAWVLGEASAFEVAELERLCEERPELLVFRRRMRALHGLLTEAEAAQPDEGWKLPEEKRKALDEIFGDGKVAHLDVEKEKRIRHSGRRAILAIAACLVLTLVVLSMLPGTYQAETTIEIKPLGNGMKPPGAAMQEGSTTSPMSSQFFGTEFEKIKSRKSLESVVDNLNLESRWGVDKETAVSRLKKSVDATNIRGTDLVSIRARENDPELAKDIANEVTKSYKAYRNEIEQEGTQAALAELNKAVRDQEDKVEERRKVLSTIVRTKGIIYKGTDSFYDSTGVNEETREDAIKRGLDAQDYVDAKREFETDQELLQTMKLKQMGESISAKIPNQSVVVHDEAATAVPRNPLRAAAAKISGIFSSDSEFSAVAAKSSRRTEGESVSYQLEMQPQSSPIPESGPSDKVALRELPAPRGMIEDRREAESLEAAKPDEEMIAGQSLATNVPRSPSRPSAPSSSSARVVAANASAQAEVPVPEVAVPTPSVEFGDGDDFGAGWGDRNGREQEKLAGGVEIVGGAKFKAQSGLRSGDQSVTGNNIDAVLNQPERPAESEAARARKTMSSEEAPVLGKLFGDKEKRMQDAAGVVTEEVRDKIDDADKTPNEAAVAQAMQNRRVGKYEEARELLGNVLTADPDNAEAKRELGYLEDPIRTSPALTYEHTQNVDKVRRNLYMAEGNFNLGKFDAAKTEYENALRVDSGNAAARRGLEKIATAKSQYYRAAYDHTRAELLSQVDSAWELSVPAEPESKPGEAQTGKAEQFDFAGRFGAMRESGPVFSNQLPSPTGGFKQDLSHLKAEPPAASAATANFEGFVNYGSPIADAPVNPPVFPSKSADPFADPFANTSGSALYAKPAGGGVEYELKTGSSSEYLLRGIDLAGETADGPPAVKPSAAADLSVVREFRYPTEYEAPIPADAATASDGFPVTPATPTSWMVQDEGLKADLAKLMEEIAAAEDPYSTFSLNISDASFQIAMAALDKGEQPDPAGIKVEQFYNAVDYGDPSPAAGQPVAVSIEQAAHPVIPGRNLVRVAVKTSAAGRSAAQPLRLTLLVDQSGSMVREDRRAAMDKALGGLSELLTENDLVTVIGFSRTPRLLADGMTGDQAAKLKDLVNQSASEGGTNLEAAMQLAEQLAERRKLEGAQNRIVLFTDGAANLGNANPERLAEKVKQLRLKGIAFDIAGIAAEDLNDGLLGELARNGNGRYYVVGKGADDNFAKQLAGAFRPAAENVKVQVRFNPERVGRYKLIGFEKDRLKTEDFRNDAVDAAELAAEEAGVAIYQVEILPEGAGEIGEVSVRFRDTSANEMVERSWTIPHDRATPAFDRATPSMQLAVMAMLAAEKLKGGPMADAIDFNQLAEPAANIKRFFGDAGRMGEVLRMVNSLK